MPALVTPRRVAALLAGLALAGCGSSTSSGGGVASSGGSSPAAPSSPTPTPSPYNPVYGLDLGIHALSGTGGEDPVPDAEITKLLTALQGRTTWIRVYNVQGANANVPMLAHQMGFKVAASAVLNQNRQSSENTLQTLYDQVNKGNVDLAIVGNEQFHIGSMSPDTLIGYINEAKAALQGKVPVATVEPDKELIAHPEIMRACDVVLANIPPISYGIPLDKSLDYIKTTYAQLTSLAGREVQIGETEWPSGGDRPNGLVGPTQGARYFNDVETWARQSNVKVFFFEAFDEPWLGQFDSVGPHWGVFNDQLAVKPGYETVFAK